MALDQRHRHAGGGEPAGERGAGLPGTDDDRIERPAHLITTTTRIATMIATASSMNAAGISLRKAAASLALAANPPRVPITAPTSSATPPAISQPEDAPSAAPDRAPDRMRAPNQPGASRLGAEGSWPMTSPTNASTVNIPTAQTEPMKASGVPASGSHPRSAAQLTTAGAVKVRSPATPPISSAKSNTIIAVPPIADRSSCPLARSAASIRHEMPPDPRACALRLFEEVADDGDRGCRLLLHQPMAGIGHDRAGHVRRNEAEIVGHRGVERFLRADRHYRHPQLTSLGEQLL